MTNEQILRKAIKKATDNGWKPVIYKETLSWYKHKPTEEDKELVDKHFFSETEVIFNHDFAKAFFNGWLMESFKKHGGGVPQGEKQWEENWQHHLQKMVLEKEPLKYLEQFI